MVAIQFNYVISYSFLRVVVPEQKVQEQAAVVPDVTFLPTLVDIHNSNLSNRSEQIVEPTIDTTPTPVEQTTVVAEVAQGNHFSYFIFNRRS
jgi:hypothetical protein